MMRVFGGIMQSAMVQAATAEWRKLPAEEASCVDRALRAEGADLPTMIRQGVMPNDRRLARFRAECSRSRAAAGREQPSGPDYYVANTRPPDAFLSLRTSPTSASGVRIQKMRNGTRLQVLERRKDRWWYVRVVSTGEQGWALSGDGERTWIECCAAGPANAGSATPVPVAQNAGPSFDCDKARTARERTICASAELSRLDRQYGEYWTMARPLDQTGAAKAQVARFYETGEACGASATCLHENLTRGIDYLSGFLSDHGVKTAAVAAAQGTGPAPTGAATPAEAPAQTSIGQAGAQPVQSVAGQDKSAVPEAPAKGPRGWIGVQIQNVANGAAGKQPISDAASRGVLVVEAVAGGPAAKAGLLPRDVITAVNGAPVADVHQLAREITKLAPHSTAVLNIVRDGDRRNLSLSVAADFAGESNFAELQGLTAIPNACLMARQIGPSQTYVRDPFTGRSSPGPFCTAALECANVLRQRIPALIGYLRQNELLVKQLNLPSDVYTGLGRVEQDSSSPLNANCGYAAMALNNGLFAVSSHSGYPGAFERFAVAARGVLNVLHSAYNADLNGYVDWLPFAKRYDHSAELAEIEARYKTAYEASDIDGALRLGPEFRARLVAAQAFRTKVVQQTDTLSLLESQVSDLSRQAHDDKLSAVLDPSVLQVVQGLSARIEKLRALAPADRGDVADDIDDIAGRKAAVDQQLVAARKTAEARRHGFGSADDYAKCLAEQQRLQGAGIQKTCER